MTSSKRTTEYERCRTLVASLTIHHPQLVQAADDLDHAAPNVHTALRAMQDARPGQPGAQSFNASGGQSEDSTTERHALAGDPTALDRKGFDRALQNIAADARWLNLGGFVLDTAAAHRDDIARCKRINLEAYRLRLIVERWKPRPPTDKQQQGALATVNDPDLWCAHHRGVGIMEPTHRVGTVGGNLNVPIPLCSPCYDQVRRHGKLPSADWMTRRARSGKNEKVKA